LAEESLKPFATRGGARHYEIERSQKFSSSYAVVDKGEVCRF
jgi:hypothetical protein